MADSIVQVPQSGRVGGSRPVHGLVPLSRRASGLAGGSGSMGSADLLLLPPACPMNTTLGRRGEEDMEAATTTWQRGILGLARKDPKLSGSPG